MIQVKDPRERSKRKIQAKNQSKRSNRKMETNDPNERSKRKIQTTILTLKFLSQGFQAKVPNNGIPLLKGKVRQLIDEHCARAGLASAEQPGLPLQWWVLNSLACSWTCSIGEDSAAQPVMILLLSVPYVVLLPCSWVLCPLRNRHAYTYVANHLNLGKFHFLIADWNVIR